MQNYTGQQCGFVGNGQTVKKCRKLPVHRRRFCIDHSDCEDICGAYVPDPEQVERLKLNAGSSMAAFFEAFHPDGPEGPVRGRRCANKTAEDSLTCGLPLCKTVFSMFSQKPQTQTNLAVDDNEKKVHLRVRHWQQIHDMQHVYRCALIGYFFFVCPCGSRPTSCNEFVFRTLSIP